MQSWPDFWFLISDFWFLISDFWFLISDFWFLISDFWFLISDFWFLISDFWIIKLHMLTVQKFNFHPNDRFRLTIPEPRITKIRPVFQIARWWLIPWVIPKVFFKFIWRTIFGFYLDWHAVDFLTLFLSFFSSFEPWVKKTFWFPTHDSHHIIDEVFEFLKRINQF